MEELERWVERYRTRRGEDPPPHLVDLFNQIVKARREHGDNWLAPWRDKVDAIFESAGDRRRMISSTKSATEIIERIAEVLTPELGEETAHEVAFHLSDWSADAAFLVALHLHPEMFDDEETLEGLISAIVHVPNHMAAAAQLAGHPIRDVFLVGLEHSDDS